MNREIILVNTPYTMLLHMLLSKNEDEIYIVADDRLEKKLNFHKKNVFSFYDETYKYKTSTQTLFFKIKYLISIYLKSRRIIKKIDNIDEIIGKGQDHLIYSRFFLNRVKEFIVIEDGIGNYRKFNSKGIASKIINRIIGVNNYFGEKKQVKKIYLTGISTIPLCLKEKVELISLKELWKEKSEEEKKYILNFFELDCNFLETIKEKEIIFFTQSLSEDGFLTEEEKIDLYKKILVKYPKEKMIIKVHPREITNYRKSFEDYLILDGYFPVELLTLLDFSVKKVVTTISTAALSFDENIEVDWYGTECNKSLFEKLGSLEEIRKTNCYL